MKFVLALSLGFILVGSQGLGIPLLQAEMGSLVLLPVWIVLPQLHSTSEHGLPSSPTRDELTEAGSEAEDDQFVVYHLVSNLSVLGSVFKAHRLDLPTITHPSRDGLFHQLHRSWQLLC
jgi:hypothetical protein